MSAEIPESEIPPLQIADVLALPQSVTIRPAKRAASAISERGQARLIRQKLLEDEQEWEDRMALGMTSEELKILQASVSSVKAEFADLDGLSWDTPSAQQLLLHWHTQQAARQRFLCASPEGLRPRGVQPRRSLSSLTSPTTSSPAMSQKVQISLDENDQFDDDALRFRPTTPLPPDDQDGDDDEAQRTPLPSLFGRNDDNECTPKPSTRDDEEQECDCDQACGDIGSANATPLSSHSGMTQSFSAPNLPSLPGICFLAEATPVAPRPVKSLPIRSSRIPKPLFRSKSFSGRGSSSAAATNEQVFSFTVPTPSPSPRTSKSVLSDSHKLNNGVWAEKNPFDDEDEESSLMSSTATVRPRSYTSRKASTPSAVFQKSTASAPSYKIKKKNADKHAKEGSRVVSAPARTTRTPSTRLGKAAPQASDNSERVEFDDTASSLALQPSKSLESSSQATRGKVTKGSRSTKRDSKRDLKRAQ